MRIGSTPILIFVIKLNPYNCQEGRAIHYVKIYNNIMRDTKKTMQYICSKINQTKTMYYVKRVGKIKQYHNIGKTRKIDLKTCFCGLL